MPQPRLIVVTGRPGSGKTTLAHKLAGLIRCPAICRDELKEGLVNTTGQTGDETARQVYGIFFETVEQLLKHQVTLVAEAAFQHQLWAAKLEPLFDIARLRIIVCTVNAELAHARCVARNLADPARELIHPTPGFSSKYDPPHLSVPTLAVDTSDGHRPALEQVVAFARL